MNEMLLFISYEINDSGMANMFPIKVDVTKDEHTNEAATYISKWLQQPSSKKQRVLHCIVNNAGIGNLGLIDWLDLSTFRKVMDGKHKKLHVAFKTYPHEYDPVALISTNEKCSNIFLYVRLFIFVCFCSKLFRYNSNCQIVLPDF